ncbi:MAG: hypothetical protein L7F77_14670 [Candidatus Magnetominusculus sp. LBB02]|nr:hypothetical protein [Candidatus Magnetominusculus sp. LBB02]
MRNSGLIREEIRDLEDIINSSIELLTKYPDDFALKLSLEQAQFRKKGLAAELEQSNQSVLENQRYVRI